MRLSRPRSVSLRAAPFLVPIFYRRLYPLRIFARLLRYILPEKKRLCLAFVLSLLGVAVELARPWPIKVVADYVLAGYPLPLWLAALGGHLPGANTPHGILFWSVAAGVAIAFGGAALSLAALYVS